MARGKRQEARGGRVVTAWDNIGLQPIQWPARFIVLTSLPNIGRSKLSKDLDGNAISHIGLTEPILLIIMKAWPGLFQKPLPPACKSAEMGGPVLNETNYNNTHVLLQSFHHVICLTAAKALTKIL